MWSYLAGDVTLPLWAVALTGAVVGMLCGAVGLRVGVARGGRERRSRNVARRPGSARWVGRAPTVGATDAQAVAADHTPPGLQADIAVGVADGQAALDQLRPRYPWPPRDNMPRSWAAMPSERLTNLHRRMR